MAYTEKTNMNNTKRILCIVSAIAFSVLTFGCKSTQQSTAAQNKSQLIAKIETELKSNQIIEPLGLRLNNIYALNEELQPIAKNELGLNGRLQVMEVVPNSIASRAGFKTGDHLVDIGGIHIPRDRQAFNTMLTSIMPSLDFSKPMQVIVLRDGLGTMLSLPAAPIKSH